MHIKPYLGEEIGRNRGFTVLTREMISEKQEEMLKLLYDAMYGVLQSSFVNLESSGFTSTSPFPHDQPHTLDSLSLIYENCALFSDIYLRFVMLLSRLSQSYLRELRPIL